ncbi:hypothetical protein SASPL_152478 [Salvia splendens]|uniref:non-specific serine/threonine protein kinase n=1 Tax=Salvia splendens TaxID=180675 RepID=A0A8X8W3C2_SALSN|nr:hypothetical protein SASPL_152478 [Salvia splendens]
MTLWWGRCGLSPAASIHFFGDRFPRSVPSTYPTYDVEITPFLGKLLDSKSHSFGFSVTKGLNFWFVDANLYLWLDSEWERTSGEVLEHTDSSSSPLSSSVKSRVSGSERPGGVVTRHDHDGIEAGAELNISGDGSGCLYYHDDLIDIRAMGSAGQDLYIRMAASESVVLAYVYGRRAKKNSSMSQEVVGLFSATHAKEGELLPFFSLPTVLKATDNFSNTSKLGEGGFGPVYRGVLEDGQEIAVKRLSKMSSQGVNELRNEVMLIAKLQHRNLVRTLGFCAQEEEYMLIYEYMPNHSLDLTLFDKEKSMLLDWQKRFDIINGIAKGLLYLHQDSRLRIIHRDLKASNILLDADIIPKISDFGLARSFGGNQTEAQTRRVIGTYFGVLVLELVSGHRNRGFLLKDHNLNLLGHAWSLYKEDSLRKLVDPCLDEAFDLGQVERAIQVGLLCVQNSPDDRPNMSSVVFMLGNEVALPQAKQPGFFAERDISIDDSSNPTASHNQLTITWTQGR